MSRFPEEFLSQMKTLLSNDEYIRVINSSDQKAFRGIRVNTLKCTAEKLKKHISYIGENTPFCTDSYYIPSDIVGVGDEPFHHAGAFYVQEPSASTAVTVLDVKKGDCVLDLCAAPGGKSTQIASALDGTGLLWSNEIVKNRANILLSNIERMGISNAVVSNCHPDILCSRLAGFFDKVLVDAPCSGEGMFRKDPASIAEWTFEHSKSCGERQLSILESASNALGEGGTLVYSTCTFSVYENENVIEKFLSSHKEFELIDCGVSFGKRSKEKCVRILPEHGGEGHFVAKLVKKGERYTNDSYCVNTKPFPEQKAALSLYDEILTDRIFGDKLCKFGDKIVILPKFMLPDTSGLSVIRAGVLLGEIKKSRIEPCHALYMASDREHLRNFIDLSYNDSRLKRFYHGEEIETDTSEKGFCAVLAEGVSTGFGKASGGVLKNRYPKGLRT